MDETHSDGSNTIYNNNVRFLQFEQFILNNSNKSFKYKINL